MLTVIGGAYREICLEPKWDHLYGSGLRAAAAISDLVRETTQEPVHLISWAKAGPEMEELVARAQSFGIGLDVKARAQSISYQYAHGLTIPALYPGQDEIIPIEAFETKLDNVLYMGVIESSLNDNGGAIQITASVVVYDPQAGKNAVPWSFRKSNADRLAIVANLSEARAIAKHLAMADFSDASPYALAKYIRCTEGAEVVIIKNGAFGAFVATDADIHHVASYKTDRVFKIGSGDIFSAVFAAYWAELGEDPVESAERASAAAAFYCNSYGVLPIPADFDEILNQVGPHRVSVRTATSVRQRHVYIAAPLFTFPQRWFIQEIRRCLEEHGVRTFSPYHDVGVKGRAAEIAKADIDGLNESAVVFAVVDGLDAGTLFEIGYATAREIPVVAFAQLNDNRNLLMVAGSGNCEIIQDFPTAIYRAAWKALEI
ncbi:MAG: PfkB family carbohydrate kinase [Pseudomonadota bacterium]